MFRDRFGGCPECASSLVEALILGVASLECSACAGRWLDRDAAATVVGSRILDAQEAGMSPRRCPVCGMAMHRILVDAVAIERCIDHGCWFDRGELERIASLGSEPAWVRSLVVNRSSR